MMTNTPIMAQAWTCTSPGFPNGNAGCGAPGTASWLGYVGIRTNVPAKPLHIYSGFCAEPAAYDPAVARLQTNAANYGFGQSSIQFWSGGLGIQDWHVGAIKPITGVNPYSAFPSIFNTANPLSPANWKGGLAFFCSGTGQQPTELNDIEVMRVVDDKVGIRTKDPLGQLDVNVGDATAKPKVSITNGTTPHLDDTYGGPQLRFYIPNDNIDSPPDRSSSYSWYIHAMRQYNPACFLGLDGTQGPTWENTTLGALHFMAGYNTASHAAGDLYRDNKGSETAIPRMSLLSNGNVGINSVIPMVRFNVHNGSVLFDGEQGSTPMTRGINATTLEYEQQEIGEGTRLMWIPSKAAFRAGAVTDDRWDSGNIGNYSVATGFNCTAKGVGSVAMGDNCEAKSLNSFAGGVQCEVSKDAADPNKNDSHASFAYGHSVKIFSSFDCMAAGYTVKINRNCERSFAFGDNLEITNAQDAFVFGMGKKTYNSSDPSNPGEGARLENNIRRSFMVGFNCSNPALFVSGGQDVIDDSEPPSGPAQNTSRVGIGTSYEYQNSMLNVFGNVTIGDGGGNTMAPLNGMLSKGAAVIGGTSMYSSQLTVLGGGSGTPASLGLMVETGQTVLGGTTASGTALLTIGSDPMILNGSGYWTSSDRNLKKDITNFSEGLSVIRQINPVRFKYNGTLGNDSTSEYIGVIAQDIQKVAPYTVRLDTFTTQKMIPSPSTVETDNTDTIGEETRKKPTPIKEELVVEKNAFLSYNSSSLMYLTVNAIKELDANIATSNTKIQMIDSVTQSTQQENKNLKTENLILNQRVKDLEEKVLQIQASCCKNAELYDDVLLEQNVPNPFAKETIITYFVPERLTGRIELVIADASGTTTLQRVPVQSNIPSQFTYSAGDLQTGVYLYGIALNGQIIKSKKMIIIK